MARKAYVAAPEPFVAAPTPPFIEPAPVEPTPFFSEASPAALATAFDAPEPMPMFVEPVAVAPEALAENVVKMVEAPAASVHTMRDKMREALEKSLAETRASYDKAKTAADEASRALEVSYATAKIGVAEINAKALEALRASADANFDFMKSALGVKSMSDYVTLHTEFARKQVEMMTGQTKEFSALAKKVADQSVEPIKAQVAKTFKVAV